MELHYLQSKPTLSTIPTSSVRSGFVRKSVLHGQVLKFPNCKKYPDGTKLKFLHFRAQASGTTKSKSFEAIPKKVDSKDEDLVFVAGATGKVGSRTIRELLKLGFRVRAGVRSAQKAGPLVQSVKQMKLDVDIVSEGTQPVEKLEIVECDLEKPNQIGPALGSASVVICCIGASEKEIFDITGPYRIDYQATKNLIDAATVAKVDHFIMVSSLGTNKIGFPAAILNLFWGVLIWKRKAEEALIASGLPYTIVRPGGMERPTDAYKETHNITLSLEDTLFGGQVSNLQVAELMAFMAKNRGLSYCKVVEVIAETTAPLTPMGELLAKIPSQRVDVTTPKESVTSTVAEPAPIRTVVPVAPSAPTETEPVQAKAVVATTLSPYTAYEDLKPPTSPAPTSNTIGPAIEASDPAPSKSVVSEVPSTPIEKEPVQLKAIATTSLSPYTAYEDLKPPTSPAPTSSTIVPAIEASDPAPSKSVVSEVPSTPIEKEPVQLKAIATTSLSPYTAYDDLKPPTSPAQAPPSSRKEEASVREAVSDPNTTYFFSFADPNVSDTQTSPSGATTTVSEIKSAPVEVQITWPLSPYAAYEDLKPPTSPVPLPRKL